MFKAVKLTRISIQVPETLMPPVMKVLGDFKLLHLIQIDQTHLGRLGYQAKVDVDLLGRYDALLARANRLNRELSPSPGRNRDIQVPRPDRAVFELEEELDKLEAQALEPISQREALRSDLAKSEELASRLEMIKAIEMPLERIRGMEYARCRIGLLPPGNRPRLEESLADIHHALIPLKKVDEKELMAALCLKEDLEIMERALRSAFFDFLELPEELSGDPGVLLEDLRKKMEQDSEALARLDQRCLELGKSLGERITRARDQVIMARNLVKAQEQFGQIDHAYIITGWVPAQGFERLRKAIEKATNGKAVVDQVDPEDLMEVRAGIIKIPILFNNPFLIRPFERLTTLYGVPSYKEVEPTVFLAVSFLLLFGMMFGDVGQGAVLTGAGYYLFRRMYRFFDYGIILMECGVSSMIFGLMYGSVFGVEDLIPALWLHPMDNVEHFMTVSVWVGVGIISLGLILNMVNILRQRRYRDLLTSSGLAGALFYWLLAGMAARRFLAGPLAANEVALAKWAMLILLTVMVFHRPLGRLISKMMGRPWDEKESGAGGILESTIEVLDGLLKYLANTVSFVRVAAFALTHAGLFVAVFSLADTIRAGQGQGPWYWLTLVVGNMVIIVLEGLVVSIQTVRLEYYEFFGKFFQGGGEPFKPIFGPGEGENDSRG